MEKRIVTVDLLGNEFLSTVKTGNSVKVLEDAPVQLANESETLRGHLHQTRVPLEIIEIVHECGDSGYLASHDLVVTDEKNILDVRREAVLVDCTDNSRIHGRA